MRTVKIITNWDENCAAYWKKMYPTDCNIQFISGDDLKADYYVIVNFAHDGVYYEPDKTIIMHMEPSSLFNRLDKYWGDPDETTFMKVLSHKNGYNNTEWHLSHDIEILRQQLTNQSIKKTKILSTVVSNLATLTGHKLRLKFIRYIHNKIPIDIYGRCGKLGFNNYKGELPPNRKDDGLYPYKYSIAFENSSEYNYFTEKITDCILSETLCFYWGCPNVDEFYPDAFIRLDIPANATDKHLERGLQQIRDAINNDEYTKRLPAIRAAKQKILYELHFAKRIEDIINEHEAKQNES